MSPRFFLDWPTLLSVNTGVGRKYMWLFMSVAWELEIWRYNIIVSITSESVLKEHTRLHLSVFVSQRWTGRYVQGFFVFFCLKCRECACMRACVITFCPQYSSTYYIYICIYTYTYDIKVHMFVYDYVLVYIYCWFHYIRQRFPLSLFSIDFQISICDLAV